MGGVAAVHNIRQNMDTLIGEWERRIYHRPNETQIHVMEYHNVITISLSYSSGSLHILREGSG